MPINPNFGTDAAAGELNSTHVETLSFSGPWAAQTGSVTFERKGSIVFVTLPAISVASTAAAAATMTAVTPTTFRPSAAVSVPMRVNDDATWTASVAKINAAGTISIYGDVTTATFAGLGGATGWDKTVLTYSV